MPRRQPSKATAPRDAPSRLAITKQPPPVGRLRETEPQTGDGMPRNPTTATWLVEFRVRPPTPIRPLRWDDYRTVEIAAPTRTKALALWRSQYGGVKRQGGSGRAGAAALPRWVRRLRPAAVAPPPLLW